jgi:hypothetical protein
MFEDGDRILDLVGAALGVGILVALVVLALNFSPPADGLNEAPETNWTVERVNDTYVAVTLSDGGPVRTDELRVTVDSVARNTNWSDPVNPDESTLVIAGDGTMVRVVWNGGRGDRSILYSERV